LKPGVITWRLVMGLVIRPATLPDAKATCDIYGHAVRFGTASFELDPPDQAEMARRQQAIVEAGYPYLVAQDEGRVLGYAYAAAYRERPAYRYTVEDSIYIAADAQRRGIGRALLASLIAEAEKRGFRQMIAIIGDSAQLASIALHRSAGFRLIGTFEGVGYKHDRWLDTVLMQRALAAAELE
jgi:L-amino acid N-acyltransferase YncA